MRVLFLTLYPESGASARYRVYQYLPYLRAQGVDCVVKSAVSDEQYRRLTGPSRRGRAAWYHLAETPRRVGQLLRAGRYDVVFVQKALMSASVHGLANLLDRFARRIVYDIDDAVFLAPPHPLRSVWRRIEERDQVRRIMASADLVTAGNDWLAKQAATRSARVAVLPTVVDTDRFCPAPDVKRGEYVVGWMGGPSTTPHLAPALEALHRVDEVALTLVGADPGQASLPDCARVVPWAYESEVEVLRGLSVGIMPLPKTKWARGKCALKALQYMACGVPCVATPFGAVMDIIRDGENGILADSTEAWVAAIERLRDPAERARMGAAARATVEESYSLSKTAPQLHDLLESVA